MVHTCLPSLPTFVAAAGLPVAALPRVATPAGSVILSLESARTILTRGRGVL
jgi:hypothetical protein